MIYGDLPPGGDTSFNRARLEFVCVTCPKEKASNTEYTENSKRVFRTSFLMYFSVISVLETLWFLTCRAQADRNL
jgi:hypothetical protein